MKLITELRSICEKNGNTEGQTQIAEENDKVNGEFCNLWI